MSELYPLSCHVETETHTKWKKLITSWPDCSQSWNIRHHFLEIYLVVSITHDLIGLETDKQQRKYNNNTEGESLYWLPATIWNFISHKKIQHYVQKLYVTYIVFMWPM